MRRKTAAQKLALGTYRASRDRQTPKFESTEGIASRPPSFIKKNKLALAEWKAVAPFLEAEGILKQPDIAILASYCVLYSRWRSAAADVDQRGQIITVTSTTRTGRTEKPVANPSVRNEILYQSAMMKAAVKFGLNPLDRPRVEASPFDVPESAYDADDAEFDAQFIDTSNRY